MNELIDGRTVRLLRELLLAADDDRSWAEVDASAEGVDGLQLRARSDLVARAILLDLAMPDGSPAAYPRLAAIVRRALDDPRFTGWMIWPVSEAVATAVWIGRLHRVMTMPPSAPPPTPISAEARPTPAPVTARTAPVGISRLMTQWRGIRPSWAATPMAMTI